MYIIVLCNGGNIHIGSIDDEKQYFSHTLLQIYFIHQN